MHQYLANGYRFDMGTTIVMLLELYKKVFRQMGRHPDDYLSMQLLDPIQELHYRDGTSLRIDPHIPMFLKELEQFGSYDA